jgi:hypothetical protein
MARSGSMPPATSQPLRLLLCCLISLQACRPSVSAGKTLDQPRDSIADQLLAGAARALGNAERIQSIAAIASVKGPSRSFQSSVYSARDGRARLALGEQFLAGIGRAKGWIYVRAPRRVAPLDDTTRSMVRGHELHMLVLAPRTRWQEPRSRGAQQWEGERAFAVEFRDNLGGPATMYLSARDTLPVGFHLRNQTGQGPPDVLVTFAQWEEIQRVRLFRHAEFAQDSIRYVYDYTRLEVNGVPDSMFEAPRGIAP